VATNLVADRVTHDGRGDDGRDDRSQGDVSQLGRDTTEDGGGLTRDDEADEEGVLGEDSQGNRPEDGPCGRPEDLVEESSHGSGASGCS
jgi:hypothetical protein